MFGGAAAFSLAGRADAESDPLPSWNAGPAKDAIVRFVRATTDAASPNFAPVAERIATPAQGLPDTKVGRFPPELYDEADKDGWIVVSMKNDGKRIFAFE
jgi:hypothetical protein